ncbi:MAG: succinate dehydrogenase assembly factor 2 [Succinivibrionaceae bacterium]|nr:succinate dehydrogenase assembly factor 2 [Succinivibrionaceae bacterium]
MYNWGKIKWQSRRGMRELDLMLLPFVEHDLPGMPDPEIEAYLDLLGASDLELFRWLHGTADPGTDSRRHMVEVIRACHATRMGKEGV